MVGLEVIEGDPFGEGVEIPSVVVHLFLLYVSLVSPCAGGWWGAFF